MRAPVWILSLALAAGGCGSSSSGDDGEPPSRPEPSAGLDMRPANAACVAPSLGTDGGGAEVELEDAFPELPDLTRPVALLQAPGDTSRWFVVEQPGTVRVFDNEPGADAYETFVDVRSSVDDGPNEAGLLGMAFDPGFAANGEAYLSYTAPGLVSKVSRFTSLDEGMTLDPGSEQVILEVNQDFGNHNGGNIAFGPSDEYLYVGFGDGGNAGDPNGRAQDTTSLLGAMLRIDVGSAAPYAIPADNPFAGNPTCPADPDASSTDCPEIYAWGLRNPWRWSFDRETGALWAGDVGQNMWEEVDIIERNGNYGWNCREGAHAFGSPAPSCTDASGLVDPVYEYDHGDGVSVTGGYVYRGDEIPALEGRYVFADFASSSIWALDEDGQGGYTREQIAQSPQGVASFAEDAAGELYVVGWGSGDDGRIRRLVPGAGGEPPSDPVAARLSETGCVEPGNPAEAAAGLIPYDVAAPSWSDGAAKERWLALPDDTTISIGADGAFAPPAGSVLVQHFRLGGTLVETRLLMHHPGGEWVGYSYEWNAAQTDASLLAGAKVAAVAGQDWIFPSRAECLRCHTSAAGFSLGLETAQLNHDFTYPGTGRTANQLATLDAIVLFDAPLGDPAAEPALADPYDASLPLGERARAYLHTNCAQCHRSGGPAPGELDLRFGVALGDTNACGAMPQSGDLDLGDAARIVAPGAPDDSVLLERMSRRDDAAMMPPLASSEPDAAGVELIGDWIAGLGGC